MAEASITTSIMTKKNFLWKGTRCSEKSQMCYTITILAHPRPYDLWSLFYTYYYRIFSSLSLFKSTSPCTPPQSLDTIGMSGTPLKPLSDNSKNSF